MSAILRSAAGAPAGTAAEAATAAIPNITERTLAIGYSRDPCPMPVIRLGGSLVYVGARYECLDPGDDPTPKKSSCAKCVRCPSHANRASFQWPKSRGNATHVISARLARPCAEDSGARGRHLAVRLPGARAARGAFRRPRRVMARGRHDHDVERRERTHSLPCRLY